MGKGRDTPSDRCFPGRPGPRCKSCEAGVCVASMDGTSTSTWKIIV